MQDLAIVGRRRHVVEDAVLLEVRYGRRPVSESPWARTHGRLGCARQKGQPESDEAQAPWFANALLESRRSGRRALSTLISKLSTKARKGRVEALHVERARLQFSRAAGRDKRIPPDSPLALAGRIISASEPFRAETQFHEPPNRTCRRTGEHAPQPPR